MCIHQIYVFVQHLCVCVCMCMSDHMHLYRSQGRYRVAETRRMP